jgi:transcription initiation factor TFIID subunit TAF12
MGVAGEGKIQPSRGQRAGNDLDAAVELHPVVADRLQQRDDRQHQRGGKHPARPGLALAGGQTKYSSSTIMPPASTVAAIMVVSDISSLGVRS